jgi:KaiC/GvpD/RAD55 family RecA-like ATPase
MDLFGLHFIERHENIAFSGPVGVGKTFLAQALGHAACRAGYRVLFIRADVLLKALARSRADNSFDRELRRFISENELRHPASPGNRKPRNPKNETAESLRCGSRQGSSTAARRAIARP